MNENQWIYNTNEEVWMNCGSYDTKKEAIQAGKDEYEGNRYQFYVGQISNMNLVPSVDVDRVIDDIAENVYWEVGEAAEDYLNDVRKEDLSELEDKLNEVLLEWMKKHNYSPEYFRVANIECIPLNE